MNRKPSISAHKCDGKVRFETRNQARKGMQITIAFWDWTGRDREPMNVYRCEFCRGFHFGHQDERKRQLWLKRSKSRKRVDFNKEDAA